jgi:hypothetical protein
VLVEREAIEVGSDNDFDTGNAKFKAVESYIPSWVDPRCVYGVNALVIRERLISLPFFEEIKCPLLILQI